MGKLLICIKYLRYIATFLLMIALVLLPNYIFLKELYDHVPREWGLLSLIITQAIAVLCGFPSPMYCFVLARLMPIVQAGIVVVGGHTLASVLIYLFIRVLLPSGRRISTNFNRMDSKFITKSFKNCLVVRFSFLQAFNKDYRLATCAPFLWYIGTGILWSIAVAVRLLLISHELVTVNGSWLLAGAYCSLWGASECCIYFCCKREEREEDSKIQ